MVEHKHPITPPPELVEQWRYAASNVPASFCTDPGGRRDYIDYIATQAARWGADQELNACCTWLSDHGWIAADPELRAARRPKPPSLAEQGLMALEDGDLGPGASLTPVEVCIIRRALERLQHLEQESNDN